MTFLFIQKAPLPQKDFFNIVEYFNNIINVGIMEKLAEVECFLFLLEDFEKIKENLLEIFTLDGLFYKAYPKFLIEIWEMHIFLQSNLHYFFGHL